MKIIKIISGGQNGADRAGLDIAIALGIPHGGWCPAGRRSEGGRIPVKYHLKQTASNSYLPRTRKNVMTADVTLVFSHGKLSGGSRETMKTAVRSDKPCIHIDLLAPIDWCAVLKNQFAEKNELVVNIAGPRPSRDRRIYKAAYQNLKTTLTAHPEIWKCPNRNPDTR